MMQATIASGQSTDIALIIRQAQDRSSHVKAAEDIVEARRASLMGSRSTVSPMIELAPGAGFTNSNAILSQEFDLFGRRSAAIMLANANLKAAELQLQEAKADVSLEVLTTLAKFIAAQEEFEGALAALESAKALLSAVSKQNEIGEAPQIHRTRAELDVLRATQNFTRAESSRRASQSAFNSALGAELNLREIHWPILNLGSAPANSFDLLSAQQELAAAEAQTRVTNADFAPTFSVGVASDIWSLDRNQFRSDNFGFQLSFKMPLFASGQRSSAWKASNLEVTAAQSRIDEAKRKANLRLVSATEAYTTAKSVAVSYEGDVLPKAEAMLIAMREGYMTGLITLLEVLEAQQTVMTLRQEQVQATLNLRLAEVEMWNAQLILPGVEVSQ